MSKPSDQAPSARTSQAKPLLVEIIAYAPTAYYHCTHCDAIRLKVIDAASVEGFYKSLRYNARRYPAVIVNGQARFVGAKMLSAAGEEIARLLASEPAGA
jgi:hypothetical protein